MVEEVGMVKEMDIDFMLETLEHIKVYENGVIKVVFLEGTEVEIK